MRNKVLLVIISLISFTVSSSGEFSNRRLHLVINGTDYPMYDVIYDTLNTTYKSQRDSIKVNLKDMIDKAFQVGSNVTLPDNISYIEYSLSNDNQTLFAKVVWDNGSVTFSNAGCNIDIRFRLWYNITLSVENFIFTGGMKVIQTGAFGEIYDVSAENSAWYRFWNYATCPVVEVGLSALAGLSNFVFLNNYKVKIDNITIPLPFKLVNVGENISDEALRYEMMNSLPFQLNWGIHPDGNLKIIVDFLPTYSTNPPSVSNPSYDYIGFACPYYAFQTLKNLPGITSIAQQEKVLIDTMAYFKTQAIRVAFPWREVAPAMNIDPNNIGSPDELTGSTLDSAVNTVVSNNSVWANTDSIVYPNSFNPMTTLRSAGGSEGNSMICLDGKLPSL